MASVFADPERMTRFFAAVTTLSSARTLDEFLKRLVHAARSLARADAATLELFDSEPPGRLIAAGSTRRGGAVELERELVVAERPYGILRLTTTQQRFAPQEEALVDLLGLHAEIGIEKASLRDREDVLERVRALLGDATNGAAFGAVRDVGDVRIDLARYQVVAAGTPVHLTPSEFRLLELLTEEPGRAYTRDEIVARLWEGDYATNPRVADAHVARLRRKIERDPGHPERLQHVRGVGYRFVPVSA
jgi:hypothetical protein